MALPPSGEISFNLFNTDRGIASGTEVNMATAGTAYGVSYNTNGSNDLRMDEFYGKSAGGGGTTTTTTTAAPYYTYTLNATPGEPSGASACAEFVLATNTYYSAQSSITTGTSLYTTSTGIGNPTFAIPNGYRSNGTSYWNFIGGSTTDIGLLCGVTTYYIVDACDGSGSTTTSLAPPLTSQRYYDGISGIYYYYTNMTTTTPSSISTTLQLVAGETGCPTTTTTTTTTAAPVYYYNATRCFDGASGIIYGGTNYYGTGTVVISGGTTYCYTIQNEVGAQAYEDTVGASVDNCNNASCYVVPTTTTTAPPTLTMAVSQTCVNYAGTGTISITGVSNGSGNYVYHIGPLIDFNDPTAYYLNSSQSGLSNGTYYVAVYDSSTGANVNEARLIDCPAAPTTTTTTTTAAPIIYSGLILCGESSVDYYYTGQISSGDYLYSGGGNCYVSTGTIGSIFGKTEIFGTINGCSCP